MVDRLTYEDWIRDLDNRLERLRWDMMPDANLCIERAVYNNAYIMAHIGNMLLRHYLERTR